MRPLMSVGRNSRTDWKRSKLYRLARRTLVASVVCLTISFINVLLVVTSQGHQRGLICLTACTLDVTVRQKKGSFSLFRIKRSRSLILFTCRSMWLLSTGSQQTLAKQRTMEPLKRTCTQLTIWQLKWPLTERTPILKRPWSMICLLSSLISEWMTMMTARSMFLIMERAASTRSACIVAPLLIHPTFYT